VGDLDRVTFSMNINGTLVRVCSPNLVHAVAHKGLEYIRKLNLPFMKSTSVSEGAVGREGLDYSITLEQQPSQPKSSQSKSFLSLKIDSERSFAERMRSLTKPNANNHLEIAAFISSILLLIDDPITKQELYSKLNLYVILHKYLELIDFNELNKNPMDFKGRSSHKTACHYVNSKNMGNSDLKSDFLIPVATPSPSQVVAVVATPSNVATPKGRKPMFPVPAPDQAPDQASDQAPYADV
jgi:hypothetical protein